MQVRGVGFATVKGTRHLPRTSVTLAAHGPIGDRAFCLVDPATSRVLRTVEHPTLARVVATDIVGDLHLRLPDGTVVTGHPEPTAEPPLTADYWGRPATLRLLAGPHAAGLAAYLGRPVRLAATRPGDVVWAGVVSVVTTGALERLAERLRAAGHVPPADLAERFRATLTLDAADDPLPGTTVRVGTATIEVARRIDRCAVVDVDPESGRRDSSVLAHLERHDGLLTFGVDARVVQPGQVGVGDTAAVERAQH